MADRDVKIKLAIDFTEGTRTQKALAGIGEEASRQAQKIDGFKKALGQMNVQDRASPAGQRLQGKLADSQEQLGGMLPEVQRLKALEGIESSLRRQKEQIAGINTQLADKGSIAERVRLAGEQEKAQKALSKAMQEERGKQAYQSKGAFGKGLSWLGIGNKGASGQEEGHAGQALAGIGAAATGAVAGLAALRSVSLASPGTMERFQIVMEDTAAVVGQTLTPVLEIMTQGMKLVGDVLASILPGADVMREALAPIGELFNAIREAIAPLVPIIKDVLVVAFKALGVALQIVILPFKLIAKIISGIFGEGEEKKLKDSTGTAARNISFTSSDQHAKSVYQAAFRAGAGPDKSDIPSWLEKITNVLDKIAGFVSSIAGALNVKRTIDNFKEGSKNKEYAKKLDVDTMRMKPNERRAIVENINRKKGQLTDMELRNIKVGLRDEQGNISKADEDWLRQLIDQAKRRALDGNAGGK